MIRQVQMYRHHMDSFVESCVHLEFYVKGN